MVRGKIKSSIPARVSIVFLIVSWFVGCKEYSGKSFTPPFRDGSVNMDNGVYEEFTSISSHVCYGLFSIGEDRFRTKRMAGV